MAQQQPAPQSQQPRHSSAVGGKSSREIRQLRIFRVILCLMLTFLVCRLPTWCYLLYTLYNTANRSEQWLLQYSFGVLSLCSCVLNPLLYTFLKETIDATGSALGCLRALWCRCGK